MKTILVLLLTTVISVCGATKGNENAFVDGENSFTEYTDSIFAQYDHDEMPNGGDYIDISGNPAESNTAKIRLHVSGGTKVWLTNWVSNWEEIPDLNVPFSMVDEQQYGYFKENGGFVWSDGSTTSITYSESGENGTHSVTTTGYLVDYFEDDSDIYILVTPRDNEQKPLDFTVDTKEEVANENVDKRWDGNGAVTDYDLAGNVKVNFQLHTYGDRTFVAVFEQPFNQTAGQPLPGMMIASILAAGTVFAGKKMKSNRQ